ncbi:MAG TPA: DUF2272 domain-containing protein [Beijerinckiaceae bacterium]
MGRVLRIVALGALALLAAGPAVAANPRLRVELVDRPKRIIVRDTACPGDRAPADRTTWRRRIVETAALEWEAFRFSTLDIASRGLPRVPTLGTLASGRTPRTIVPDAANPPLADEPARRLLRVGLSEDAAETTLRIGGYWAVVPLQSAVDTQNALWRIWADTGWAQPWSAAFVSWVMCEAGLPLEAFDRHPQHAGYIAHLYANPQAAFAPQPITERAEPGDLVCAGRGDSQDVANLEEGWALAAASGPMHCDIVVGGAPDRLYLIGGNVENSVTLTVAPARDGRIEPNAARRWFGVFRLKAPSDPDAAIDKVGFACLGRPDAKACLAER